MLEIISAKHFDGYDGDSKELRHEWKEERKELKRERKHWKKMLKKEEKGKMDTPLSKYSIFSANDCPSGFVRIGWRCIGVDY
ncbi:unnamed protein product [Leptosia nina]|uniref:Uncharacterized protein n=1 Tax=Leptosia nina TaxID=320188 RepID=A0AAV1J2E3_9NEOP